MALCLSLQLVASSAGAAVGVEDWCCEDSECTEGSVCTYSGTCRPVARVCEATRDCEASEYCAFSADACAPCSRDTCGDWGRGFCEPLPYTCPTDSDCPEDRLCWASDPLPGCRDGDISCGVPQAACRNWGRFCGGGEPPCLEGEACADTGRCVPENLIKGANLIEVDEGKMDRLAADFPAEEPPTDTTDSIAQGLPTIDPDNQTSNTVPDANGDTASEATGEDGAAGGSSRHASACSVSVPTGGGSHSAWVLALAGLALTLRLRRRASH